MAQTRSFMRAKQHCAQAVAVDPEDPTANMNVRMLARVTR